MKHFDGKSSTFIDFRIENNEKNPASKIGDIVSISKYENIFANGYTPKFCDQRYCALNLCY